MVASYSAMSHIWEHSITIASTIRLAVWGTVLPMRGSQDFTRTKISHGAPLLIVNRVVRGTLTNSRKRSLFELIYTSSPKDQRAATYLLGLLSARNCDWGRRQMR